MFKWTLKGEQNEPSQRQKLRVKEITFLCEQDGNIEKQLKARWIDYFKTDVSVTLACLVRVSYGDSGRQNVALCLSAEASDKRALVESITSDFRALFKTTESLDIIFLSPEQERRLLLVAKPFYTQAAPRV